MDSSTAIAETSAADVESYCAAAAAASAELADLAVWPLAWRASLLRGVAAVLDAHAAELAGMADQETSLGTGRLTGEVGRTTWQLRLLADVAEDGAFAEVIIDHTRAAEGAQARPDLRRMLLPIGPVAVYAASNFPFAFSVAGGDTAAALAAGCPVVVKAHPGHPRTSQRTAELVQQACSDAGAPDGTFLAQECFGPSSVVAEYRDGIIWNGWPTGVAVTWAMHHGGPRPATTVSIHTSVGPTAIRRFLVPVTFQDMPAALLPDALLDANPLGLPRRVDGRWAI